MNNINADTNKTDTNTERYRNSHKKEEIPYLRYLRIGVGFVCACVVCVLRTCCVRVRVCVSVCVVQCQYVQLSVFKRAVKINFSHFFVLYLGSVTPLAVIIADKSKRKSFLLSPTQKENEREVILSLPYIYGIYFSGRYYLGKREHQCSSRRDKAIR